MVFQQRTDSPRRSPLRVSAYHPGFPVTSCGFERSIAGTGTEEIIGEDAQPCGMGGKGEEAGRRYLGEDDEFVTRIRIDFNNYIA